MLNTIALRRPLPRLLKTDNGSEFAGKMLDKWVMNGGSIFLLLNSAEIQFLLVPDPQWASLRRGRVEITGMSFKAKEKTSGASSRSAMSEERTSVLQNCKCQNSTFAVRSPSRLDYRKVWPNPSHILQLFVL